LNIEIIDKRNNTVKKVSEDYKIEYAKQIIALKDLQYEDMKVFGVIIQEDGEIDLCYIMEKITRMATYYNKIKKTIIDKGYENEIMWINNIPNPVDKDLFFREYSWVVINSGMKNTVAEKIFRNFWNNNSPDFSTINHLNKNKALKKVYNKLDFYFRHFIESKNKLMFLESLPHIGNITKYHLARNLGLNYAKPDRHLVRISSLFKYSNVQEFCNKLSILTDDPIGVVDLVLWRFATLYPNYLELIKKEVENKN